MTINSNINMDIEAELKPRQYDVFIAKQPNKEENETTEESAFVDPVDDETIQESALPSVIPIVEGAHHQAPAQASSLWLSIFILLLSVCSGVCDQQLMKDAFSANFNAPFFMLFVGNSLRLFALPVYVLVVWLVSRLRRPRQSVGEILRQASIFESKDPLWIYLIRTIGILTSNIIIIMSLAIMALAYATVSECTAVATTQVAMFYFVAVVFMGHKVLIVKLFAVIVSLVGVGVIAYAKGVHSSSAVGIGLTMLSTIIFALNITYYKTVYKKLNLGQCCMFISASSLYAIGVFWWLPLSSAKLGVEIWDWESVPWTLLLMSAATAMVSSISINYGISVATPLLMSFSSLLRIPFNILVDFFLRHVAFTELELAGSALIVVGFLLIIVPDHRVSIKIKHFFTRLST